MNVSLDIGKNLKDQFNKIIEADGFDVNSGYSNQKIKLVQFPDDIEFYHFELVEHKIPIYMTSTNAKESDWFLIHINIGTDKQLKRTENQTIDFHRYLPSGILIYCPGLVIKTNFYPGHKSELVSIRIPKSFFDNYYAYPIIRDGQLLLYLDLDQSIENKIYSAIDSMRNKLSCHIYVLQIIEAILDSVNSNDKVPLTTSIHKEDINNLFNASVYLRNPLSGDIPSIEELASIAKMSASKFKKLFKQFFGSAPYQYHFKIKMEYARKELNLRRKTPVELSFDLGYSHPSNFTSAYKSHFNTLPSTDFGKSNLNF